jgi:hypothetical protein
MGCYPHGVFAQAISPAVLRPRASQKVKAFFGNAIPVFDIPKFILGEYPLRKT